MNPIEAVEFKEQLESGKDIFKSKKLKKMMAEPDFNWTVFLSYVKDIPDDVILDNIEKINCNKLELVGRNKNVIEKCLPYLGPLNLIILYSLETSDVKISLKNRLLELISNPLYAEETTQALVKLARADDLYLEVIEFIFNNSSYKIRNLCSILLLDGLKHYDVKTTIDQNLLLESLKLSKTFNRTMRLLGVYELYDNLNDDFQKFIREEDETVYFKCTKNDEFFNWIEKFNSGNIIYDSVNWLTASKDIIEKYDIINKQINHYHRFSKGPIPVNLKSVKLRYPLPETQAYIKLNSL